tara:strand:- start:1805 stop:1987 length:183 start_codon:yes stop_codon:yes gene_type:complete
MPKEKFYDLLEEMIQCLIDEQHLSERLSKLEKHSDSMEKRLGEVERRYAMLARSILNDGK